MNAKAKGYILGSIAAASYGMNPLFALPLYKAGMDPDSVLFFRYLFAIPLLGIMIKARGRSFKIQRKETFPLIIMGSEVKMKGEKPMKDNEKNQPIRRETAEIKIAKERNGKEL